MNTSLPPPRLELAEIESRFSTLALWSAIRKNWIIIVLLTTVVAVGVAFYTLGQTRIYEAEATVLFDPQPPRPLGNDVKAVVDVGGEYWSNKEYYKTQFWVITSQRIAVAVVKSLALNKDQSFLQNRPSGSIKGGREASLEEAARVLRGRISIEPIKDSRLAAVKYRDADPQRAQRIVTAIVDVYTDNNLDDALDAMNLAADWLGNQVDSLKNELEQNEMALHDYKMSKNILSVSLDDQSNMLRAELEQLTSALTAVRTRREQIGARRTELSKINPDDPQHIPATELLSSPLLQNLRSEYVSAASARQVLLASGKGPNHPDVQSVSARVEAAKAALLGEVSNLQTALNLEYNAASNEKSGLEGLIEAAKQRALQLNLLEIEYNRLRRSKDNSEKMYGIVTERAKENDLTRLLRINNIRVVDRAQVPKRPVSPNLPLNLASGIAVGLALGLAAAVGRAQLDRSIRTPDDAERVLGLNFLGLLPNMDEGKGNGSYYSRRAKRQVSVTPTNPELVVHEAPTSGVAEAARAIRTNIIFMSPDRPFRRLLVTSAAPAEGKTTVACCVAVAMAQAGRKVALLDCDMRRPRIHRVFGLRNDVGVTTALVEQSTIEETIRTTSVPNLSVVTTGPIPPNPAELLHSEAFERFLRSLEQGFDSVVIDSPPVAPVTDAAVLSTKVDCTILVVRAFKTSKDIALRAVRALRGVGTSTLGSVLNAVDFQRRDYGYQQYYYYRREGYSADEGPPVDPPSEDRQPSA